MREYPYWLEAGGPQLPASSSRSPTASPQPLVPSLQPLVSSPQSPVDVAVVGGGYTGLAAARSLARAGASVAVFERDAIGSGASSRNGGQVLAGLKLDPQTLVARYGESQARRLFEIGTGAVDRLEALVAEEAMACDYARCGHLQAAWKPKHFDEFRAEQALLARAFGHRVELVSRGEQRAELGSDLYHGLLVDERSGAINPARYVHELAAAARRAGASLAAHVSVRRLDRRSGGWRVVTSAGGVEARDVLLATDGYTDEAAPALRRRIVPIGSYIIATEPLAEEVASTLLPRGRVAFDSKYFLYYFRVTPDRRLLFGGRAEFSRPTAQSARRAAEILRRGMAAVFPQIASARVDYAWGGSVGFTRDQMPHAGRLDGAYYAGGYCGHGIAMATYLGELVARRIAGDPAAHPLLDAPFDAIPLYRGNPWFLPLVGAWYRIKDWLQ